MNRRLLAAVALLVVLLVPAAPAWAHTQLVSANPAQNATLATAPTAVTLEFSARLNPDFTTIVISDADRRRVPAAAPAVDGAHGTVILDTPVGNGVYTVAYRVVSADGHQVQGSYAFTVADPARPAAAAAASPAAAAAPSGDGGIPVGVLIGLAVAGVFLAATAAGVHLARRRRAARTRLEEDTVRRTSGCGPDVCRTMVRPPSA